MKGGRRCAAAAALLMLLSACSDGDASLSDPPETVGTAAPQATTASTADPYAVPAVIDVAYVNRVLAGLDGVIGEVVRMVVRAKTIPPEAVVRLRAIYGNDDRLQLTIDSLQEDMRTGFSAYRADPGNRRTAVTQLLTVKQTCVFAQVQRDYTAVGLNAVAADTQWVVLKPASPERDKNHYNATNWMLHYDGFQRDRTAPPDPCANT